MSKCVDEANMSHYKSFLREIEYVINTKYYFYQIKLEGNLNTSWDIRAYSDTNYVEDNNIHKIMTGCIIIINGVGIA